MNQKTVYQYDANGLYVGETKADPDPEVPSNWLMPAGTTEIKPPLFTGGKVAKWVGYKWKLINQ